MAFEYKQSSKWEAKFDPDRCKASVHGGGRSVRFHQCLRKPWKDGWCKQHHPDSEKARLEESQAHWNEKWHNRTAARLSRCMKFVEAFDKWIVTPKSEPDEYQRLFDAMMDLREKI